jgi:hypothetical protein
MTDTELTALEDLTIDSFAARVGERFMLEDPHASHELALVECASRGQSLQREAFSLTFVGPTEPVLAQRIYRLRNPELGAIEIFLVPIGVDANGTHYEAAFN